MKPYRSLVQEEADAFDKSFPSNGGGYSDLLDTPSDDKVSSDWGVDMSKPDDSPSTKLAMNELDSLPSPEAPADTPPSAAGASSSDDAGDGPGDFKTSGPMETLPPVVDAKSAPVDDERISILRQLANAPDDIGGPSQASQMAIEQARGRDKQNNLDNVIRNALFSATTRSGQSPYGPESHSEERMAQSQQQHAGQLRSAGAARKNSAMEALSKALTPKTEDPSLQAWRLAQADAAKAREARDTADLERKKGADQTNAESKAVELDRREQELAEKKREFDASLAAKDKAHAGAVAAGQAKAAAKVKENEAANTITFDGMTLHGGANVDKEERHKTKEKLSNTSSAISGMDKIAKDIQAYIDNPGVSTKNVLGTDVSMVAGSISQGSGSGVLNESEFKRYSSALGANPLDAASIIALFKGFGDDPEASKGMLSRVQAARKIMRDGAVSYANTSGFKAADGEKHETAAPSPAGAGGTVTIKRLSDGKAKSVSKEQAAKFLSQTGPDGKPLFSEGG